MCMCMPWCAAHQSGFDIRPMRRAQGARLPDIYGSVLFCSVPCCAPLYRAVPCRAGGLHISWSAAAHRLGHGGGRGTKPRPSRHGNAFTACVATQSTERGSPSLPLGTGWGEWTGMNQALQVNYTCGNNVLGMIADVNFNDNYVNVSSGCLISYFVMMGSAPTSSLPLQGV